MSQRWPLPQIINRQSQIDDDASLDPGGQVVSFAHRERCSDCLLLPLVPGHQSMAEYERWGLQLSVLLVCFIADCGEAGAHPSVLSPNVSSDFAVFEELRPGVLFLCQNFLV